MDKPLIASFQHTQYWIILLTGNEFRSAEDVFVVKGAIQYATEYFTGYPKKKKGCISIR